MTEQMTAPTLTPEQEEQLRAVIVEANPDKERSVELQGIESGRTFTVVDDTIRLADVLLAIHVKTGYDKRGYHDEDAPETSIFIDDLVNCHWDLRNDSLDDQSPDCKRELFDLLCTL